ncbi:uncharacterized protein LOC106155432, partial [Lingula anatina]|uniref:Uncharacterized protein LOC106155432 n=1 Tax=Lingula anatina TaxID=7574 RepID=A0A1S3HI10_LINAN
MSVTSAMDVIDYEVWNFNYDPHLFRHPLWMTSNHLKYRLYRDNLGVMHCLKDGEGRYIKSPRSLSDVCIYDIVCNLDILRQMQDPYLPLDLYPRLLSEAIYQRELHAIEYLIATWPQSVLKLYDVVPLEDQIEHDYLTTPIDGNEGTNLLDCIMLGLLNRQPQAMMQVIDFTGFEKDRKLCRELSRLPVLWMEPEDRTVNMLYDYMYPTYEIAKDKIQRYLNRISVIYHQFDNEFKHGTKMGMYYTE